MFDVLDLLFSMYLMFLEIHEVIGSSSSKNEFDGNIRILLVLVSLFFY